MKALFSLLACMFFFTAPAQATISGGDTGVGVMVGSPNGINGRTWFDGTHSVDYAAGWNLGDSSKFQMHVDYLWMRPGLIDLNGTRFDLYFGGGLSFRTHSGNGDRETVFGPRVPVGTSYEFTDPNLELFAEFAVNIGIIPSGNTYVDANIGARIYF
jgi:hypothetical protein